MPGRYSLWAALMSARQDRNHKATMVILRMMFLDELMVALPFLYWVAQSHCGNKQTCPLIMESATVPTSVIDYYFKTSGR